MSESSPSSAAPIHTEIDGAVADWGQAAQSVQRALVDVRESGKRIVPVCPYVARFLEAHTGCADIADPVTVDVLPWLETEPDQHLADGRVDLMTGRGNTGPAYPADCRVPPRRISEPAARLGGAAARP